MAREDRKSKGGEELDVSRLEKRKKANKYFPEELEMEILLRQPAKSLVRFRCVCKRWCHLFSTHRFMSDHVRTFNVNQDLLLVLKFGIYPEERYPLYLDARYPEPPKRLRDLVLPLNISDYAFVTPVGHCNGVVCFVCVRLVGRQQKVDILIWNPSINKSVLVPVPDSLNWPPSPTRLDTGGVKVGFGFTGDDYKLVAIPKFHDEGKPVELGMYSLRTGNWKIVAAAFNPRIHIQYLHPVRRYFSDESVFLNQSCHWYIPDNRGDFIMSFNLIDKALRRIELPDRFAQEGYDRCFGWRRICLYNGCLSVVGICRHQQDESVSGLFAWVMKEYGNDESWTRIVCGNVARPAHYVVGFRKGGEVIYSRGRSKLVSYDPVIKSPQYFATFFDEYGFEAGDSCLCLVDFYKESLFLHKEGYGQEEEVQDNSTDEFVIRDISPREY